VLDPPAADPVEELVAAVRRGRPASSELVKPVFDVLALWLGRRGLSGHELQTVCNDAVMRLIAITESGELDPGRPAGAWLRVVADHLAIDALRRRGSPAEPLDDQTSLAVTEDDRIAMLIDSSAAASDVRAALQAAADAGEHKVHQVVSVWLGLALANGETPSSREVGERMGISHMSVQRYLRRFGELLSELTDVPRPEQPT